MVWNTFDLRITSTTHLLDEIKDMTSGNMLLSLPLATVEGRNKRDKLKIKKTALIYWFYDFWRLKKWCSDQVLSKYSIKTQFHEIL